MSEKNGKSLSREILLAQRGTEYREPVQVPGLGTCFVKALTAGDRETWEAAPKHRIRPLMVVLTACDEEGRLLFAMSDLDAVAGLPITVIMPLFDAGLRIAKVSAEDVDALEKNSEATHSNSSPISSASPSVA